MLRRSLTVLLVAVGTAIAGTAVAPGESAAVPVAQRLADRDCGDFGTQAAAQRFFLDAGGPQRDPHRLDADGDGIACETNPCPCSTSQGGGGGGGAAGAAQPRRLKQRAVVVKVVDGDTVRVRLRANRRVRDVRVIGVDTPEVFGGTQCWGPQASAAARRLLPVGTPVLLVSDRTQALKDRYGRLLRYVMKRGRVDVGRWQVHRGNARVYVFNRRPFERVRGYRVAQSAARNRDRGLWGHC